jgi:hypothetical protein
MSEYTLDDYLEDNEEEYSIEECPICGGDCYILGNLGNLSWYRCRDCGMEFNIPANK